MHIRIQCLLSCGLVIFLLIFAMGAKAEQPTWQADFDQWFTLPNHRDMAVSYTAHINQRYDDGGGRQDQPRLNFEFDFLLWAKGESQTIFVEIAGVPMRDAQGHLRHVLGEVEQLKNVQLTYIRRDNEFYNTDDDVDEKVSKLDFELRKSILPLLFPKMPAIAEPTLRSEMEWETQTQDDSTVIFSNVPAINQWSVVHVEESIKGGPDEPGLALIQGDRLFSRRTKNKKHEVAYTQANIWYDNESRRVRSAYQTIWFDQRRIVSWRPPSEMHSNAVRVYETQRVRD